jgi:hypothetical protein
MAKETLTAKVSPKNLERLEKYAEREGISKSEATDRLVKQGLDVEESDMRLVPVRSDGGTIIEDRLDEIERHQQNRLSEIEQTQHEIQSELDQPWYAELVDDTVLWSWALTLSGVFLFAISGFFNYSSDLATMITLISGVVFVVSKSVQEVI